jgi:two-component system sensor histidine kinase/response regulator
MGNMDLYQRLLKGFAKTQQDFAEQYAAAPDKDTALRTIHTLKGLAGNIGATRLLQAAGQLEASLQTMIEQDKPEADLREQVNAQLALTLDALQSVLADIERLNRPSPHVAQAQQADLKEPELRAHWARLSSLLIDNDAQARDFLQELMQERPQLADHPRIQELLKHVERYDFEAAARMLEAF